MNKSLHSLFLMAFLLVFNFVSSQSIHIDTHFSDENNVIEIEHLESLLLHNHTSEEDAEFSYTIYDLDSHEDHDHAHEVSLIDILSSDEGTDFNCSGGFCMNKSHFHKKGLTLKKQLFVYFMSISC